MGVKYIALSIIIVAIIILGLIKYNEESFEDERYCPTGVQISSNNIGAVRSFGTDPLNTNNCRFYCSMYSILGTASLPSSRAVCSLSDNKCISIYNKSIKLVQKCKPGQSCNYNIPDL